MENDRVLEQCLQWSRDNDFGIPVPSILLGKLREDYGTEIRIFLETLKNASEEARKRFYPQIYETLYVMAAQDDAEAIRRVFALCPDMCREGYYSYDQTLPLGDAIEQGAYKALEALLDMGCNIHFATFAPCSTIGHAVGNDCPEEMILWLLNRGAVPEFEDVLTVWVYEGHEDLAKKMLETAGAFPAEAGKKAFLQEARACWEEDADLLEEDEKERFRALLRFLSTDT